MKFYKYLLILFLGLSLISCGKKEKEKINTDLKYGTYGVKGEGASIYNSVKYIIDEESVKVYSITEKKEDLMSIIEYELYDTISYIEHNGHISFYNNEFVIENDLLISEQLTLKYESASIEKPKYRVVNAEVNSVSMSLDSKNEWIIMAGASNYQSYTLVASYKGYSVTTIAPGAFSNNTNLQSITIPESITKIGSNVFGGRTTEPLVIKMESSTPCVQDDMLMSIENVKIIVPKGSGDAYKSAWLKYLTIIEEAE